jgi:hypothetical protein
MLLHFSKSILIFFSEGAYGVSKADFWALATIVSVEMGIELSNKERDDELRYFA